MIQEPINLLEEIDSISKIHTLKRDDIDALMIEMSKKILATLRIERISAWLFNTERTAIISIGEYDLPTNKFSKESILLKSKYPSYFKAISENEIVLVENIITNQITKEFAEDYSIPNNLISLMDIPLRIDGKLIGVMCFEKTGKIERIFNKTEQTFALSCALIFSSNMEARQRRALQYKLDLQLQEKDVLIKEMHHRVKNNLAVISSLMNLQSAKTRDAYHKALFDECRNKIDAISGIHEIVYKSESFSTILIDEYLKKLLVNLQQFYASSKSEISMSYELENVAISLDKAVPLALIVNEVITNAYKHAFPENGVGEISISLNALENKFQLVIKDNGKGFNPDDIKSTSLGIDIIMGLTQQIEGEYFYDNISGTTFSLTF